MTGLCNVTCHSIIADTLLTSGWVKIIILSNLKFHLLLQVIKKFVLFLEVDVSLLCSQDPHTEAD